MPRVLLSIFALLFCVRTFAADWTIIKYEGRDYIPFDNVSHFYSLGPVQKSGNAFSIAIGSRSLRGASGSVEFFINNLKFNLSYPVIEHNGELCVSRMDLVKVIEPVLRPGKISNAEQIDTVVLDPGHGGHDNGAMSPFGNEKAFTLDVGLRARLLFLQMGYKVYMTRTDDEFIPLEDRVRFANRFPNALFISIHFNSGGAGTGLETYTLAPRGVPSMMADGPHVTDLQECPGNVCDAENMALATATHASLVVHLHSFDHGMYDRGIKRARFVVIRDIMIPGVLVEGGFLSNLYDAKLVANPEYRQSMAASIVQAVQTYRRAVGPTALQLARTNATLRSESESSTAPASAPPEVGEAPANPSDTAN